MKPLPRLLSAFALSTVLFSFMFARHALAADMPEFELVAKDGVLSPAELVVPANTKFKLKLRNEGKTPEEFESTELRVEKVLAPGAQSFVVIQSLKPGEYKFFGEFHPQTANTKLIAR